METATDLGDRLTVVALLAGVVEDSLLELATAPVDRESAAGREVTEVGKIWVLGRAGRVSASSSLSSLSVNRLLGLVAVEVAGRGVTARGFEVLVVDT